MHQPKALIVWGGWEGHQPQEVAEVFASDLTKQGFAVEMANTLDAFLGIPQATDLALIVPIWTMGTITPEQLQPVLDAVRNGVGLAGCHGGMCDAFRNETEWHFMTGGQWVSHPGNDGVKYTVQFLDLDHEITSGMKDFEVCSEQYYLHVDPGNKVLATTRFPVADGPHVPNGETHVPVSWTKLYGKGRVFYCSLGHQADIVAMPEVSELMTRGFLWAARQPLKRA